MKKILSILLILATLFSMISCAKPAIYTPDEPYSVENHGITDEQSKLGGHMRGGYTIEAPSFAESLEGCAENHCIAKVKKVRSKTYYWKDNTEVVTKPYYYNNSENAFYGGYTVSVIEILEVFESSIDNMQAGAQFSVFERFTIDPYGNFALIRPREMPIESAFQTCNGYEDPEFMKPDTEYLMILCENDLFTADSGITQVEIDLNGSWNHGFEPVLVYGTGSIPAEKLHGAYTAYRAYEFSKTAYLEAKGYLEATKDPSAEQPLLNELNGVDYYYYYTYEANKLFGNYSE